MRARILGPDHHPSEEVGDQDPQSLLRKGGNLHGSWDWGEPASSLMSPLLLALLSYGIVPLGILHAFLCLPIHR